MGKNNRFRARRQRKLGSHQSRARRFSWKIYGDRTCQFSGLCSGLLLDCLKKTEWLETNVGSGGCSVA